MPQKGNTERLVFLQKEAYFRQTVHAAHRLFCTCEDPLRHLMKWRLSTDGEGATTEVDEGLGHSGTGEGDTAPGVLGG